MVIILFKKRKFREEEKKRKKKRERKNKKKKARNHAAISFEHREHPCRLASPSSFTSCQKISCPLKSHAGGALKPTSCTEQTLSSLVFNLVESDTCVSKGLDISLQEKMGKKTKRKKLTHKKESRQPIYLFPKAS